MSGRHIAICASPAVLDVIQTPILDADDWLRRSIRYMKEPGSSKVLSCLFVPSVRPLLPHHPTNHDHAEMCCCLSHRYPRPNTRDRVHVCLVSNRSRGHIIREAVPPMTSKVGPNSKTHSGILEEFRVILDSQNRVGRYRQNERDGRLFPICSGIYDWRGPEPLQTGWHSVTEILGESVLCSKQRGDHR